MTTTTTTTTTMGIVKDQRFAMVNFISLAVFLLLLPRSSLQWSSNDIRNRWSRSISPRMLSISSNRETDDVTSSSRSLAGDYLVDCRVSADSATLSLTRLSECAVSEAYSHSQGAKSWACLHGDMNVTSSEPDVVITAVFQTNPASITVMYADENKNVREKDLIAVLVRVLAQWGLQQFPEWDKIVFPDGTVYNSEDLASDDYVATLFDCQGEVVEMVDQSGSVIAKVPRPLVHKHNILHRGIGLFVCTNFTSTDSVGSTMWYVHRRTATKRIFPDLYDMFVGGVSLAGEKERDTAIREVGEELGLRRGHLSDPILTCVVCTAYNRCFVTLFAYQMNLEEDVIALQEEEVAWGDFCPYQSIQASADRSIQRLVSRNEWPGRLPAIQSPLRGTLSTDVRAPDGWTHWDFVPDGLLVWEAWLNNQVVDEQ